MSSGALQSVIKCHASWCAGWSFQIHLYVQTLEHMATIHLGIGLIITILNFIEHEKSSQGRKVFGKWEKNFCFPPKDFCFFHQAKFWKMNYFHRAVFRPFFCRSEPTRMLLLIISHLKSSWWKGYAGWEETSSSVWVHLSHSLTHWDKTFLKDVQIQIFFWEPSPRCSSVRTWRSVVSTTISGVGQWMAVITTKPLLPNAGHSSANLPYCGRGMTILCLRSYGKSQIHISLHNYHDQLFKLL